MRKGERRFGSRWWTRIALAVVLAAPAAAQIEDFEGKREEARRSFVTDLEAYSEWCRGHKMFLSRKRALDLLLELVPGHEESLKALGYKRGRDGVWKEPRRPKKFKDFDDDLAAEAGERWDGVTAAYLASLHALLGDPDRTRDQELLLFEDILPVDPNDPRMRAARGEVRSGESWVLEETIAAQAARQALTQAIERGRAEDERFEVVAANRVEAGLGFTWTKVYQTPAGRVLGTAEEAELLNVARALSAGMALYRQLFGESRRPPTGFTAFVLADPEERHAFLSAYPNLPDEDRTRMAQFTSTWIDRQNHAAVWMDTVEERVDGLLRLLISKLMARDFQIAADRGWIHEGLGLYLTEAVLGTRLTWFVQPEDSQTVDRRSMRRLLTESSTWLDEAGRLFVGVQRPRLGALVAKPLAEFSLADILHAYTFGAYLVEAHGERLGGLARRVGRGTPAPAALEEVLGRSLGVLDERLLRWLAETGHAAGS